LRASCCGLRGAHGARPVGSGVDEDLHRAWRSHASVRVTTAFRRLLGLSGIVVRGVSFGDDAVVVEVGLRRGRLECPLCSFSTRSRYDTRTVSATWRHLDFGRWRVLLRAPGLRRLRCPTHGCGSRRCPSPGTGLGSPETLKSGGVPGHQDRQDHDHPDLAAGLGQRRTDVSAGGRRRTRPRPARRAG
jgi:hypothetical protein